jgi:outer membrane protein assembly factor BamB
MLRFVIAFGVWFAIINPDPDVFAQEWTRFHGPNGTGVVADANLPTSLDKPLWTKRLAGVGSSCPVAWDDRIFVTSCDMHSAQIKLQCLSMKDGEENWIKLFESTPYHVHDRNTFAASTPAVDQDHVYACITDPDHTTLVALDHDGDEVWRRDFGRFVSSHGFGASPIVYKDLVILCSSQSKEHLPDGVAPGQSRLYAVNKMTGEDAWSLDLSTRRVCYSVPCVWKDRDGNEQLVNCNTGDGFYSVDPVTGIKNWSALPFKMRVVATPLVVGDLLIGSCGSGGGGNYLVAIKPQKFASSKNDATAEPEYTVRSSNYVPCPVAVGDSLFIFTDKGIAQCVNLKTGELQWKERLSSGFSASPVANGTHIYAVDEEGIVFVIKADKEFERVGKFSLGESTRATPMIAKDKLFFRTASQLISFGKQN